MILEQLYAIIQERIKELPKGSYVVSLVKQGEDRVIQKLGEEAVEVVIAAKGKNKKRTVEEVADLYFMTIVLLAFRNIGLDEVFDELEKRRNKKVKD